MGGLALETGMYSMGCRKDWLNHSLWRLRILMSMQNLKASAKWDLSIEVWY